MVAPNKIAVVDTNIIFSALLNPRSNFADALLTLASGGLTCKLGALCFYQFFFHPLNVTRLGWLEGFVSFLSKIAEQTKFSDTRISVLYLFVQAHSAPPGLYGAGLLFLKSGINVHLQPQT